MCFVIDEVTEVEVHKITYTLKFTSMSYSFQTNATCFVKVLLIVSN